MKRSVVKTGWGLLFIAMFMPPLNVAALNHTDAAVEEFIKDVSLEICHYYSEGDFPRITRDILKNRARQRLGKELKIEDVYHHITCDGSSTKNLDLIRLPLLNKPLSVRSAKNLFVSLYKAGRTPLLGKIVMCRRDFGRGCLDVFEHIDMRIDSAKEVDRTDPYAEELKKLLLRRSRRTDERFITPDRNVYFCREFLDEPTYCDAEATALEISEAKQRFESEQEGMAAGKSEAERQRLATFKALLPTLLANLDEQMVRVPGGAFTMGCTDVTEPCDDDSKPAHRVWVSSFEIGKYEVTQGLWEAVMGNNPSHHKHNFGRPNGSSIPVHNVMWNEVRAFVTKLNALTGERYRLPTEAEWEYAARGGQQGRGYRYAGSNDPKAVARHGRGDGGVPEPVGQNQPNELGLYDMSGNVSEWVQDWYGDYPFGDTIDPQGPASGMLRVHRGGAWNNGASSRYLLLTTRGAALDRNVDSLGFRLVRPVETESREEAKAKQRFKAEQRGEAEAKAEAKRRRLAKRKALLSTLRQQMVRVQGGTFTMGCMPDQEGGDICWGDAKTDYRVRLSSFEIGKYEVTQDLWEAVMGDEFVGKNPSSPMCSQCPVQGAMGWKAWDQVQAFIRKLNTLTGERYRLPTEAEWEYAAKGGQRSRGYRSAGSNDPKAVAWCDYPGNADDNYLRPVGQKQPNELGLYDMNGNVSEFVQGVHIWTGTYPSGFVTDPQGLSSLEYRVARGGSWEDPWREGSWIAHSYCTPIGRRSTRGSEIGFRLVRPLR